MRYSGSKIETSGGDPAQDLEGIMREQDSAETLAEKIALQRELISTAEELLKMEESGQTPDGSEIKKLTDSLGEAAKRAGVKLPHSSSSLAGIILHYSMYDNIVEGIFKAAVAGYKLAGRKTGREAESEFDKNSRLERFHEAINEAWHELAELEAKQNEEKKPESKDDNEIKTRAIEFYEKRLNERQEIIADIFQNEPEAIDALLELAKDPDALTQTKIIELFSNKNIPSDLLVVIEESLKKIQPILRFDSAKDSLRKTIDDKLNTKVEISKLEQDIKERRGWFFETDEGRFEYENIKEKVKLEKNDSTK